MLVLTINIKIPMNYLLLAFAALSLSGCFPAPMSPTVKLVDYESEFYLPIIDPVGTSDEKSVVRIEVPGAVAKNTKKCKLPENVLKTSRSSNHGLWFELARTSFFTENSKAFFIVTNKESVRWDRLGKVDEAFLKMALSEEMVKVAKGCFHKAWMQIARERLLSTWPKTFIDWLNVEYRVDHETRTGDIKHGMSLCLEGAVQSITLDGEPDSGLGPGGKHCYPVDLHATLQVSAVSNPKEILKPLRLRGSLNTFLFHQNTTFPALPKHINFVGNAIHFHTKREKQPGFYRIFNPKEIPRYGCSKFDAANQCADEFVDDPFDIANLPVIVATTRADMLDIATLCQRNKGGSGLKEVCGKSNPNTSVDKFECIKPLLRSDRDNYLARCTEDDTCTKEWANSPPLCFVSRVQGLFYPEITVFVNKKTYQLPVGTRLLQVIQYQGDLGIDSLLRAESSGGGEVGHIDKVLERSTRSLHLHRLMDGKYVDVNFTERTRSTLSLPLKHGDMIKW